MGWIVDKNLFKILPGIGERLLLVYVNIPVRITVSILALCALHVAWLIHFSVRSPCAGVPVSHALGDKRGAGAVARWRLGAKYETPSGDVTNDVWRRPRERAKSAQLVNPPAPFA